MQVIIGLVVGYTLAAITTHEGNHFVSTAKVSKAPAFTFLWTTTFPLSACLTHRHEARLHLACQRTVCGFVRPTTALLFNSD